MKLGVVFGYWGAGPRPGFVEEAQAAERLGYDSVWVAESWGNDAFTYAAYVAANTSTIKIGTGIVQMAARTPTATTMAAVTLDHLSNGRLILGLGVSGPQVVEGWYGQPSNRPLARTREYVDIIRRALLPVKGMLGFYIGGMGAKGQNFHTKLMQRMGFEEEALKIQDLFFAGKRDEAIMAVPDDFADEISIVGPPSRIKERLEAWRDSPVTTLLVAGRDHEQLEVVRDLVLG
jgi:alkanesulfonate monooxygenase SsuD/methylene tetrahydromethanopterin reductase-like flavin-dependent oxidoreductase (luciferase family)